jgi:hypothetical protein
MWQKIAMNANFQGQQSLRRIICYYIQKRDFREKRIWKMAGSRRFQLADNLHDGQTDLTNFLGGPI